MSRLDDELAEAVKEAEAVAVAAPVAPAVQSQQKRRNVGLLIGLLAVGSGMLMLVMTSFDGSGSWSRDVDKFVSEKERMAGRNVKITGLLVKGSLRKRDQPCEYRFELSKGDATLPVRYAGCVVPDTFRDAPNVDVMVTADGKLDAAGHFQAAQIFTKCPSKYEMQQLAAKGEKAPHTGPIPAADPQKL
jgi:cytochrome c-type biogenesis protein CcmE